MTFAAAGGAAGEAVEAASVAIGVQPVIEGLEKFIEGGAKGAENFTKAFNDKVTGGALLLNLPQIFTSSYNDFKKFGETAAEDVTEGFNAVLKANTGTDFEFASSLFKQVEDGTAKMVTDFTSKVPLIGGAMTDAFNEGKDAVDGFLGLGQEWLESITEIGNAYIEVGRTIAATSAGENLEQLTDSVRQIMATGANVFLDDVSHSIGRLNDNIHGLSMDQLKELVTTFAQAEELVGKFSPTQFAGVINAYDLSAGQANETLTHLVNISRQTGEGMTAMMGEMTRVGPAMRNLGYDAEQTGQFFGQMVEYGERGTRLIYGMNEVAAKLNKQILEGKAVGFDTIQGGFEKLIATVKEMHKLGEDNQAKGLLGQFTTPSTAPLLFELINKGVLDAASMRKELEGINSPLVEALDETKSLDDALRLISEQVKANLEPIGNVLARGLAEAGTKVTEWLAEHQAKLIGWADTITETVLTVFGKVAQGIADTLSLMAPGLDIMKDLVVGTLDAMIEPIKWLTQGLGEAADFLGLDKFKNVMNDISGGANTALGVLGKMNEVDITKSLDAFDAKVTDINNKGIPNLNSNLHKTAQQFQEAAEMEEAFKEKIGGEMQSAVEIEHRKGPDGRDLPTFPEDGTEPGVLKLQGTIDQQKDVIKKLEEIGIMIDANTEGVVKRITFKTEQAKKAYEEWYAAQTKKSDKLEVPLQGTKNGEPVDSAQELVPDDGSTTGVGVGGDGGSGGVPKTYAPLPSALPYTPGSLNLPTGLGGAARPDLSSALAARGFSPEQIQAIQGFSSVEGNNPAGNPTLGFMDRQLGGDSSLMGHVNALIKQISDRASVTGPFPSGGSAGDKANWIANLVGQNGSSSGPDGLAQPARSDYVNRVATAMGGSGLPSAVPTTPGGSESDAQLLAGVPKGTYLQTQAADLSKGIGDCSSSVEDLINMMDGASTAGRQMATGNAAQWLSAHGFEINTTGANIPGAFNVGFNDHHMQATLPGGTNFNWGGADSAARGGVGGSGAFDPAFTDHYYRMPGAWTPGAATGGGAAAGGTGGTPTGIPVFVTNWPGGGGGFGGGGGGGGGGAAAGEGGGVPSALPSDGGPPGPRGPLPGPVDGGPPGPRGPLPGPSDGGLYSPENTSPALSSPPAAGGGEGGGAGGGAEPPVGAPGGPGGPGGHVNTIQVKLASSDTDLNPFRVLADSVQAAMVAQRAQALLNPAAGASVGGPAGPYMDDNLRWRSAQTGRFTGAPAEGFAGVMERSGIPDMAERATVAARDLFSGVADRLAAMKSDYWDGAAGLSQDANGRWRSGGRFAAAPQSVPDRLAAAVSPIADHVEALGDDVAKMLDSVSTGVSDAARVVSERAAAASAEVGAAGAEFSAGMEPVIDQLGTDLKSAWAQYVENYSKTTMGQLLSYLRDLGSRVADSAAQVASNVATATREGVAAAGDIARSIAADAADMTRTVIRWGTNISDSVAQVARSVGTAMDEAGAAFMEVARSVGADAVQMAQAVKEPVVRVAQSTAELGRTLVEHAGEAGQAFLDVGRSVAQDARDMGRAAVEFARPIAVAAADSARAVAAVTVEQAKAVGDNIVETTRVVTQWMGNVAAGVKDFAQTVAGHATEAAQEFNRIAQSIGADAAQMAQDAARIAGTIGTRVADTAVGIRDAIRAAPGVQLLEQSGRAGIDAARASFPVIDQLAARVGSWGPQIAEQVKSFAAPLTDAFRSSDTRIGASMIPRVKTVTDSIMDATRAAGGWMADAARGVTDFAEPLLKTITDSKIVQVMGDAAKFGGRALAAVNRFDPLGIGLSAAIEAIDPYQRKDQTVKYDDGSGHVVKDQLSQQFGGSAIPDHVMSAIAGHQFTDWWQRASYQGSADQKADTDVTRAANDQLGVGLTNAAAVNYNRAHPTPLIPGVAAPATQMPAPGVSLPIPAGLSLQAAQNLMAHPANSRWDAYRKHLQGLGYTNVPDTAPTGKYYDWDGSGAPGFKDGGDISGFLPGYGGGDRIPILAEGGEFIFNKEASARWGDLLPWMNAQKFQPGGPVGGGNNGNAYLLDVLNRQNSLDSAAHEYQQKSEADPDIQAAVPALKEAMEAAQALLAPLQAQYNQESDFAKANDTVYSAQYTKTKQAIDAYNEAVKKAAASTWDVHEAQVKMATEQLKPDPKDKGGPANKDAEALGKGFLKGVFQEMGFADDASGVFGKPFTEWGIFKLATGLFNYGNFLGDHMGEMGPIGPQNIKPQGLFGEGANSGGGLFSGLMTGMIPDGMGGGQQQQSAGIGLPGDPSLMTPALAASAPPDGGPPGMRGAAPGPAGPVDNRTITNVQNNNQVQHLPPPPPASAGSRP